VLATDKLRFITATQAVYVYYQQYKLKINKLALYFVLFDALNQNSTIVFVAALSTKPIWCLTKKTIFRKRFSWFSSERRFSSELLLESGTVAICRDRKFKFGSFQPNTSSDS
jgi:hypothetical protein